MTKLFVGSCSDDSVGVGYVLIGTEIKKNDEDVGGYQILTDDGWVHCYDVMRVSGSVESPCENDLS